MVRALSWYTAVALLVLQAVLLIVSIRAHLVLRTVTSRLLMCACICYAVACSSWYTVYLVAGFLFGQQPRTPAAARALDAWHYYIDKGFQLCFVILLLFALKSLQQQMRASGAPTI